MKSFYFVDVDDNGYVAVSRALKVTFIEDENSFHPLCFRNCFDTLFYHEVLFYYET